MDQPVGRELELFRDEMRQLVYVFSHDMRNPLVNMKALLNEMRDSLQEVREGDLKLLEQGIPDTLEMFEQTVEQMNEIIRGANDIYHCMFDDIECERVELQQLVERISNRLGNSPGIEFSIGKLPSVWADPLAVSRVVEQLLDNAVNAMGANGGVISISANRRAGSDVLVVRDTGEGIPEEEMKRIFDPFYSRSNSASGMGLAIVKALIEAHSGSVWCESRPGAGSIFYVSLPEKK